MMMKDFRYIIKRILIGIGICVGLFYLKSCNVYALESSQYSSYFYNQAIVSNPSYLYNSCHSVGDNYLYVIDSYEYKIEYKSDGIYINDFQFANNSTNDFCNRWIIGKWPNSTSVTLYYAYGTSGNVTPNQVFMSGSVLSYSDNFPVSVDHLAAGSSSYIRKRINFSNGVYQNNNTANVYSCNAGGSSFSGCFLSGYNFIVFGTDANYRLFTGNNIKWIASNFNSPNYVLSNPFINSLNPVLNKTDEGMLVSVSFTINFSYVDNENYNYYAWFSGYDKLKLISNDVVLNTQQNTTLYVEITDKQGNNIDSETFNVSSIGMIYDGNYDIQYSVQEFSESDTTNDSDAYVDYINRVDVDVTYIPQWINYRYYYQFVRSGNELDDNEWILLNNNSAKNNFVYTTHNNGTLYTKIEDTENNVLYSSTFVVTRIGGLKVYDKNSGKIFNMFNNIKNEVNFGGPISNLIVAPVNVLETILQATTNTCVPYDMGTINGHRIVLDCIEPDDYLGSTLWTTIDILISFCLSYSIMKWLSSLYYGFVMLQNTPDIEHSNYDRKDDSIF